jgi:hypothetical protein
MSSGMPYDKSRYNMIKEHKDNQEKDAGGKDKLPKAKLIVKGQANLEPIYKFDISSLAFNMANGRIKAEIIEKEAELGRHLNEFEPEDQNIIKDILLSIRTDENSKIKDDLMKNGQLQPGIITCDGIVINGNRRKALLEDLYQDTKDEKYKYLEVQVLPSDIRRSELWLIEAGIQLSTPQQLDYSPINHLLKLRDGIKAGLKIEEMAARIYGVSKEKIENDLKRLDLMDEYLSDFIGKSGKYYIVKNLNEHFIDLHKILRWANQPRGPIKRDWEPQDDDINELKAVAFYFIRMKMPHLRIRELQDIFAKEKAWSEAKKALEIDNNLTDKEREELRFTRSEEEIEEDFDNSDTESTFTTSTEERDLHEEALWRERHQTKLKSYYEDAKEQEQIIKDSKKPLLLAKRALKNLNAIPEDSEKLEDPEMDDVLGKIISRTNTLRKPVHKKRKGKGAK